MVPKRIREFQSDDPWETPYGRIETDPKDPDGLPFTGPCYMPGRFEEWDYETTIAVFGVLVCMWIMVIWQFCVPENNNVMVAREEALRRRRLYREKQEWDILGEPDFTPATKPGI